MAASLTGPCGTLPGSATVRAANVPGHCKARANGCGAATPFRLEHATGDREFYCAHHVLGAIRAAGAVLVLAYDPPLVVGDTRVAR